MTVTIHPDMEQGSDEWLQARCGLLTASEVKLIVTPGTLKAANNEKTRAHVWELAAQRLNNFVEPHYVSDAMLRGKDDEILARDIYHRTYEKVTTAGFITNDSWGFTIGYSPDGLVGHYGQIEVKSRNQRFQVETMVGLPAIPDDFILQVQTGLLVSKRAWCDFISYSNGMEMIVQRVLPDLEMHAQILSAAISFEARVQQTVEKYRDAVASGKYWLTPTERIDRTDIIL